MSTSKLARSGSDSWSMMPQTAHDGLTETTTAAAGPTPCETHDAPTATDLSIHEAAVESDFEESAAVAAVEAASQASADSWVEVTAAELESPSNQPLITAEEVVEAPPATEKAEEASQPALASAEPSAAVPLSVGTTATEPVAAAEEALPPAAPPTTAPQPKIDLTEFLAGLTLTKAYEATAPHEPVTEHEAAAQVLASFDATELTDDFTSLAADDREVEETIDLENMPSSLQPTQHDRSSRRIPTSAMQQPPKGGTEVLRRRMVAEDWMRTLRGPSELTPQERVEVFQALFGDTGDAPISAERFKEMMVPYERHCDCLGASYGFHHQGCRFYEKSEVTS